MRKSDVIQAIFHNQLHTYLPREKGLAFAPTNIALCKYWGKRDIELNLPMTSSLSISLPDKGALTSIIMQDKPHDTIVLNGEELAADSNFVKRTSDFLNWFRQDKTWNMRIEINMNIPVAAGLASSACGFASLVAALNDLFHWQLSQRHLSVLARLGSGSAARSLWNGFVEWHAGVQPDGMDCFAEPLPYEWPELYVGILEVSSAPKAISSREAMQRTVDSSTLYQSWPKKVTHDLIIMRQALHMKNFSLLAGTAESNALSMHATMLSSWPPICYFLPETISAMHKVWALRRGGLPIFFTQDAGANLKLLFLEKDRQDVVTEFPNLDVIRLFE